MANSSTHRTIMISSGLMGAQQVVRLAVGIVQSKIVAVLLGTAGTGAFGTYASLMNLWQSVFGLGVAGSGVRQIAASRATDTERIPHSDIQIQLQLSAFLGALAGFSMFVFRVPLSRLTFGSPAYSTGIGFVAGATGIALMTTGLLTALKGMRRIRDLTFAHLLGAFLSAVCAVFLIFLYRDHGIAPSFLAACSLTWLAAWFLFRRIGFQTQARLPWRRTWRHVAALVRLGGGFMSAHLFIALSAYAVRAILAHNEGIESAGLYQSAWMLSTFYCTMVLQAMGADFLPRISAVCGEKAVFNRQVNEQTEVGLIIVVPGILFCMVAAAPVLRILYTSEFVHAVSVSRWMMTGMLVRAAAWPLAYIPLARNAPFYTFLTEGIIALLLVSLSAVLIPWVGLEGAGIAFFLASIVYTALLLAVTRRLCGFVWSRRCWKTMILTYCAGFGVFTLLMTGGLLFLVLACIVTGIVIACCGYLAIRILKVP